MEGLIVAMIAMVLRKFNKMANQFGPFILAHPKWIQSLEWILGANLFGQPIRFNRQALLNAAKEYLLSKQCGGSDPENADVACAFVAHAIGMALVEMRAVAGAENKMFLADPHAQLPFEHVPEPFAFASRER